MEQWQIIFKVCGIKNPPKKEGVKHAKKRLCVPQSHDCTCGFGNIVLSTIVNVLKQRVNVVTCTKASCWGV